MPKKKNTVRADGRIAVQVYIGRREDGTRQYKTVYGATQKEADEKANQVRLSMRKGIDISSEHDSFKQWADRWVKVKKSEISAGRLLTYKCSLKKLTSIYALPISKIRTSDIQEIILELAEKNPSTGKPAAVKTLMGIKSAASQIFRLAIENRVMDYNPANAVRIPKSKPAETKRALTDTERLWIENTPHRSQIAAMIMLYAGLRRGELIPLTWMDIDLEQRTIQVNKSVEIINGKSILKDGGKTAASVRTVDIPQKLVDFLRSQPRSCPLVCPSASGKMLSESGWKRLWESYLKTLNLTHGDFKNVLTWQNGKKFDGHQVTDKDLCNPNGLPFVIPRITAHWLRHTFATMLYMAEVDVVTAKEQLGHSDIKTTLEIYTHLDKQFKRKSMNRLDAYLDSIHDASQMQVKCKSNASQAFSLIRIFTAFMAIFVCVRNAEVEGSNPFGSTKKR